MRPILMKGHERPLTFVKYNSDGDLLFSMAKDHNPTIWRADDGTRLGVYKGHNGAVFTCDVTHDSARLVTGSADQTVRLWDVRTGEELHRWSYREPARSVDFGEGEKLLAATTDPFMGEPSKILVYRLDDDPAKLDSEPVMSLTGRGDGEGSARNAGSREEHRLPSAKLRRHLLHHRFARQNREAVRLLLARGAQNLLARKTCSERLCEPAA